LPHEAHVLPKRKGWAEDYHGYGTLGYTVAAQGPDGVIHLITSMNHPAQEFEMNEAWILSDAGPTLETESPSGKVENGSMKYPNGAREAAWSGRVDGWGRYRLDGPEIWYYPSGARQYEVTWHNGAKTGAETHWDEHGRKRWEWEHAPGGDDTWMQYWPNGNRKHLSHWHEGVCVGAATAYDVSGNVIGRYEFENGSLKRASETQQAFQ
jgi:hypothetical protein